MAMKVLVADDSGVMRKIIIRGLSALGITEIVEAGDGIEAIKHFQEHSFDLVLTDWNMPGKTGIEVLKEIRASGAVIPVVLITTEVEKRRVLEAISLETLEAGGYSFQIELKYRALKKGFRFTEFPITFEDRRVGKSKMSSKIVVEALGVVPRLRLK